MSTYLIKSEDKIAFINRLNKKGVNVDSHKIVDNESEDYFEFTTDNPDTDDIVKTILKQSPKINQIKEMLSITKSQLTTIIREELKRVKKKKSQLGEQNYSWPTNWPSNWPPPCSSGKCDKNYHACMEWHILYGWRERQCSHSDHPLPKPRPRSTTYQQANKNQSLSEQQENCGTRYSWPSSWPSNWPPPCSSGKCGKKGHCMDCTTVGWVETRCSDSPGDPHPKPRPKSPSFNK